MTLYTDQRADTEDEYATKAELWRPISDAVGGFDIDPASGCEPTPIAPTRYTKDDDGLTKAWHGRVWLNPPFSDKLAFFRKAVNEYESGNADLIVAVAPVDSGAQWYQNWFSRADVICWLEGRDWYDAGGSPSFNTMVGVFGEPPQELIRVLERKGVVTEPTRSHEQETLI